MAETISILVVDDTEAGRYTTGKMLKAAGFAVVEASCGIEALSKAQAQPDLIVLDVQMPDMSGFEVCKRLKADPATTGIPVLHLTATYLSLKDKIIGLDGGADGYLTHPVEQMELVATINALLRTKQAEKAAEQEARRWLATFNAIIDPISLLDRDGRIMKANRAFRDVAAGSSEVIGNYCYECVHGATTFIDNCPFVRTLQSGKRETLESQVAGCFFEVAVDPVFDEKGEICSLVHIMRDITAHKRAEDEKARLEVQLRQSQKMESIGTLAGGVAHDFNNILTVIVGYGDLSLMKMPLDDPCRFNLEQIRSAADRAAHLTKDLLLFSRKQKSERKPVDLNDCIGKMEHFLKRIMRENINCRTNLLQTPLPLLADSYQLDQIIMNLAMNAQDAMPDNGTFSIATDKVELDEQFIRMYGYGKPGWYARLDISDTGTGMDEVTCTKIFEPFFSTKEVGKGTGLGLAVVYGIVKQHDGFINVHSEPGNGTLFHIYLPLAGDGGRKDADSAEWEAAPGGNETILLAEDNDMVRDVTTTILESAGYSVIVAVDGDDALTKFAENASRIDLLLLDLIMPGKNGNEVYDEIARNRPEQKVIFASGYAPDTVRGDMSRDIPILFKPVRPDDLLRAVRKVLDGGG